MSLLGRNSKSLLFEDVASSKVASGEGEIVEGVERAECLPFNSVWFVMGDAQLLSPSPEPKTGACYLSINNHNQYSQFLVF